ncbi:hypothetical protein ACFFUB_10690 [Algimonas porphyrae]|uniref:Flagellar FliJ protein n=1 Tax=Algimonas porphyrae TaxID=1128113 RepID=A0ABQ5V2W6_9PROT|nr:hypothetical protein [Algimonas porphyrae]GLQ21417.1 hypothetical protein GCM10007854_23720 [Algimonas porphyrae]
MALRTLVTLKRAALQTQIDALNAREAVLIRKLTQLDDQTDGALDQAGGFQRAAMARNTARSLSGQLNREREQVVRQRDTLLRERLTLDIASEKLEADDRAQRRLEASRADLKG